MIHFVAKVLRVVHMFVGVSAPPPGKGDKKLVFMWVGILAVVIAWSALLLYFMLRVF
jgi:hypothetical protein